MIRKEREKKKEKLYDPDKWEERDVIQSPAGGLLVSGEKKRWISCPRISWRTPGTILIGDTESRNSETKGALKEEGRLEINVMGNVEQNSEGSAANQKTQE